MRKTKQQRQLAIKSLIEHADISRQEDLVTALNQADWQVTQATISRDIAEMQLIKVPQDDGTFKYAVMSDDSSLNQLKALLNEHGTQFTSQDNLIMINVLPGSGPALKTAINQVAFDEIFGTISDDDSVLIILKTELDGATFMERLR